MDIRKLKANTVARSRHQPRRQQRVDLVGVNVWDHVAAATLPSMLRWQALELHHAALTAAPCAWFSGTTAV